MHYNGYTDRKTYRVEDTVDKRKTDTAKGYSSDQRRRTEQRDRVEGLDVRTRLGYEG